MIGKVIITAAFVILAVPHEPDLGLGRPAPVPVAGAAQARDILWSALDRVQADLTAHGARIRL